MKKKILIYFSFIILLLSISVVYYDLFGRHPLGLRRMFNSTREMADYLISFGPWSVVASILMMILQTLFTPVPLFLVAGANGYIFGVAWGIVITMAGALLGSTVAFFLARFIARDFISKRLGKYREKVDQLSERSGMKVVFLARLVPVIPSSVISYAAGLSKMGFGSFFLASVFGKLPEIVIYNALGHSLDRADGLLAKVTIVIILLTLLLFPIWKGKHQEQKD
ncbi:DedA family inner membrane protein YdjZ [Desulfocucumis palustris]|uniref:TVP38/TMEM64 family membrane protein n=1 Tax=Desulfocucumis palustris TaxID=1898651 RepID=A0A2L2XGG2_9FIRM|nr:TVP38/TMEM64 family protein [Desulfocucumis palustris]GBF35447.1 DedA family inner membrane protein YdjZ [Desulfocucumis palustris]